MNVFFEWKVDIMHDYLETDGFIILKNKPQIGDVIELPSKTGTAVIKEINEYTRTLYVTY